MMHSPKNIVDCSSVLFILAHYEEERTLYGQYLAAVKRNK